MLQFWQGLKKGWAWVRFVWQILTRLGSPWQIAQALARTIKILGLRTLKQWGMGA